MFVTVIAVIINDYGNSMRWQLFTVDMMRVLQGLHDANEHGDPADVEYLSPYMTTSIKRFGSYHLDLKRAREPWLKEAWFQEAAQRARAAAEQGLEGQRV